MADSSLRKIVCATGKDILSDMPKNIIDIILELLPIRDAVRTSILSRKWHYRWATLSKLVFDTQFFASLKFKFGSELQVKDIINKLLLLHTGPLQKFVLQTNPVGFALEDDVSQWLLFLSRKGIKEFTLHYSTYHPYRLGLQLYSCLALTRLNLRNCKLDPPAAFVGFPNLTILALSWVDIGENFGDFISNCPQLQQVVIDCWLGTNHLIVQAPNLINFHVRGTRLQQTVSLVNIITVTKLSICVRASVAAKPRESRIMGISLGGHELLGINGAPKRLPTTLDNLKHLILSYVDFGYVADISLIICVIRSSPKLSILEIKGVECYDGGDIVELYGMADDWSLNNLRIVKLSFLRLQTNERALIKYILANSPLLEKMFIQPNRGIGVDVLFAWCKELMLYARASPNAALVYLDPI